MPTEAKREATREAPEALESFLPLAGPVKPSPKLVALVAAGSFEADQYESLRHLVRWSAETRGHRVFVVTSAAPGDGKTLTSVNLAGALAHGAGARVLLVEGDLRQPAVLAVLGLEESAYPKGLVQVAFGGSTLRDVVRRDPEHRLHLAPAGEPSGMPYDVLSAPPVARFFEDARRHFDFVIVDAPPAVGFPDYRLLEKLADASLLVVSEGVTARRMLQLAVENVDAKKSMGIVLNRADVRDVSRYYESYYRPRRPAEPAS